MRRLITLLAIAGLVSTGMIAVAGSALAVTSECGAVPGNLVLNGGFETGDASGWSTGSSASSSVRTDRTIVHDDSAPNGVTDNSAYVHCGGWGFALGSSTTLSQTVTGLTPGATYKLSWWMDYPVAGPPNSFQAQVSNAAPGSLTFNQFSQLVNTPLMEWQQLSAEFTLAANSYESAISFTTGPWSGPQAFGIDDVVVTPAPSECDAVAGNLVQNCGFDAGDHTTWENAADWTINGPFQGVVSSTQYPDWVHSGSYGAFLADIGSVGSVSQTLAGTTPSTTYSFSYWMDNPRLGTPNSWAVQVSNVVGGPLTFDSMTNAGVLPWTRYTHTFTTLANGTVPTISFRARNDVGDFGLDDVVVTPLVSADPVFTSADSTTFTANQSNSFTVTTLVDGAHGTATLSCPGCDLGNGVVFTPGAGGTATIAGTPAANAGGVRHFDIVATNGHGSTTQHFTLTIDQSPHFTGNPANPITFTVGSFGSYTYKATGYPDAPTISVSSATPLPAGLSLATPQHSVNPNGDQVTTVSLKGTPVAGTGGTYTITLSTHNSISPDDTKTVQLTVYEAPRITSPDHATFTALADNVFQVTAAGGYPTSPLTFSESGALPPGVSLSSSGLLAGDPPVSASGYWQFTITASNGPTSTDQVFTLFVHAPAVAAGSMADPGGLNVTTLNAYNGECVTWHLTGYAPYAPVTVIGYPTMTHAVPFGLGTYDTNANGRVTVNVCLPNTARGSYTLLAAGYARNGTVRYAKAQTIVQP